MTVEDSIKERNDAYHEYLKACLDEGKEPLTYNAWRKMPSGEFRGWHE